MSARTGTAAIRVRCAWWLCGQCHGGEACRCLPAQQSTPDQSNLAEESSSILNRESMVQLSGCAEPARTLSSLDAELAQADAVIKP